MAKASSTATEQHTATANMATTEVVCLPAGRSTRLSSPSPDTKSPASASDTASDTGLATWRREVAVWVATRTLSSPPLPATPAAFTAAFTAAGVEPRDSGAGELAGELAGCEVAGGLLVGGEGVVGLLVGGEGVAGLLGCGEVNLGGCIGVLLCVVLCVTGASITCAAAWGADWEGP